MSSQDLLADALTKIRNASAVRAKTVIVRASKFVLNVLKVLKSEGYIQDVKEPEGSKDGIIVYLKYLRNGRPVINELSLVSKRSRKVYVECSKIPKVARGLGICILSTSQGVISGIKAKELNTGGELICTVR
jgi:small subunit ribosomal protein S8